MHLSRLVQLACVEDAVLSVVPPPDAHPATSAACSPFRVHVFAQGSRRLDLVEARACYEATGFKALILARSWTQWKDVSGSCGMLVAEGELFDSLGKRPLGLAGPTVLVVPQADEMEVEQLQALLDELQACPHPSKVLLARTWRGAPSQDALDRPGGIFDSIVQVQATLRQAWALDQHTPYALAPVKSRRI